MKIGSYWLLKLNRIAVWAPRWHDRKVLIAKRKVKEHNLIVFTKAKSLPGKYYMSADKLRKYPLETNGVIDCYAVPLDDLEEIE